MNTEREKSGPAWREQLQQYEKDGFAIFRNVLDAELLGEANEHVEWLKRKYPELRPEHFHHPLMRDDAFWVRFATDARLLDIAELFVGPNVACFTAHYICKPAFDGQAVLWHQDGAYWKIEPLEAVTIWVAIDTSSQENGCLWMVPGSHRMALREIRVRDDVPNMLWSSIVDGVFDRRTAVPVELRPGDVSVHSPYLIHGSEPNTSPHRRCGLDLGFMPTTARISNTGLYMYPLLVRGDALEGVNSYREWPMYNSETSMHFRGCDKWNEKIKANCVLRQEKPNNAKDEDVLTITRRMIERLKTGTTKQ
jgi:phytanoyl-CoA hydroxylase